MESVAVLQNVTISRQEILETVLYEETGQSNV